MNSKVLIIIITVIVLIVGGGAAYLILGRPTKPPTSGTTPPPTTTTSPNNPATTLSPTSILAQDTVAAAEVSKKRFDAALEKLRSWSLWKENAQFGGLFMSFTPALEYNTANEVYVFGSSDDPNHHITVSVAQSSGNMLRALIPVSDYQNSLLPIKREFWQSNYVEAVQFADKNGGRDFMTNNQIVAVDVQLKRTVPNNYLYWVVTYKTADLANSLTVKMDAKEKTLVTE